MLAGVPRGQRGQALVGVMVVMVLLFALAGAVAIAASTLLVSRGNPGGTTDDFRLRSAVNDSVAQVAGSTSACWAAPGPGATPSPSPIPTPLALRLAPPDSTGQAQCVRMDGVTAGSVQRVQVPPPGTGTCRTLTLPSPSSPRVAVVFDVNLSGTGWAYLDDDTSCRSTPPPTGTPCASRFGFAGAPPASGPAWSQVTVACDVPDGQTERLHVRATATSPRQVFVGTQDPHASSLGSLYLLAVQSPVAASQMEETLLFVSGGSKSSQLLFEAPLQP